MFFRGLIATLVLIALSWRRGELGLLATGNWRAHAARSLFGTASMWGWFIALTLLPFADLTAITFTSPLFITVLAMLFLNERIHGFRWTALVVGFIGVLIMIGPHLTLGAGASIGVWIALGTSVLSALAMLFLRSMSGREHAITITFYFSLTTMAVSAISAFWGWPAPSASQWLLIIAVGVLGAIGQLLLSYSYRYAEASTLAPLDYANLVYATVIGYFLFGELPGWSTWLGAPLVVASGLLILWREYQRQR